MSLDRFLAGAWPGGDESCESYSGFTRRVFSSLGVALLQLPGGTGTYACGVVAYLIIVQVTSGTHFMCPCSFYCLMTCDIPHGPDTWHTF